MAAHRSAGGVSRKLRRIGGLAVNLLEPYLTDQRTTDRMNCFKYVLLRLPQSSMPHRYPIPGHNSDFATCCV